MRRQVNSFAACCNNCASAGLAPLSAWDDWFTDSGTATNAGTVGSTSGVGGLIGDLANLVNLGLGINDAINTGDRIVTPGGQTIYNTPNNQVSTTKILPIALGAVAVGGIAYLLLRKKR